MMLQSPRLRPGDSQVPGARTPLPEVRHRKLGPLRGRPGSFPHGHQPAPRGLALLPHRGPRHSPWPRSSGPGPEASPAGAATPPTPLGPPPWPPAQGCPARCLPAARRRPPGGPGAGNGAGGLRLRANWSCRRPRGPPRKVPGASGPPTVLAAGGRAPQAPALSGPAPRPPRGASLVAALPPACSGLIPDWALRCPGSGSPHSRGQSVLGSLLGCGPRARAGGGTSRAGTGGDGLRWVGGRQSLPR